MCDICGLALAVDQICSHVEMYDLIFCGKQMNLR